MVKQWRGIGCGGAVVEEKIQGCENGTQLL